HTSSSLVNRRIPVGTYGGVRGRGLTTPSYSIYGRGMGESANFMKALQWHHNSATFERYSLFMERETIQTDD
ncbi:hypothetical protein, partial [Brevibacillus aydinogluensis]|uniref:hypothetical protein n=1 Tax=Brevibacillus aydinogluensis TaxID=927786 RepID=UPI002892DA3E